jgi:hypothetical protein
MVDMEQFVAQITPLIILMILFPAGLMIFYFTIVRPYVRKRAGAASDKSKAVPAAPSALDMLRQAQTEAVMEDAIAADPSPLSTASRRLDTGDLPDLGMLLNPSSLKRDLPETAPAPAPQPRSSTPAVRQMTDTPQRLKLNTGDTTSAKEMLTVLRDENDGRLMVQIGTTGYRSLLDSPEAKKLFTTLMKELSSSIMTPDSRPTPADEAPPPVVVPPAGASSSLDALRGLSEPAPKPASRVSEPRRSAPPPPMADGSIPGALPSYRFDDNPAKVTLRRDGTVKKVDFIPPPTIDIPSAIEAYLQYKIEYTPEFQGQDIHIRSGMGGGVRIQVGDLFYDSVDDVEDPDARAFLKEAIAEWQERQ